MLKEFVGPLPKLFVADKETMILSFAKCKQDNDKLVEN